MAGFPGELNGRRSAEGPSAQLGVTTVSGAGGRHPKLPCRRIVVPLPSFYENLRLPEGLHDISIREFAG